MEINPFETGKVLCHFDKLKKLARGKMIPPVTVEIDPSNRCNHNCKWCMYSEFRRRCSDVLDKVDLFDLLNDLKEMGVKSITFTGGGEPLTSPHICEAMLFCKENEIDCGLVTNGGLLDKEIDEVVAKTCKFIRVSLDATNEKDHSFFHGTTTNDFDRILENLFNIRVLNKHITIGVAFLVYDKNYIGLSDLAARLDEIGVDYLQVRPVIQGISFENAFSTMQILKRIKTKEMKVIPVMHRFHEIMNDDKRFSRCLATPLIGVVGADGNVYLCCQFRGDSTKVIGNIHEKRFKDIWFSDEHRKMIDSIDVSKCPVCRYIPYNIIIEQAVMKDGLHKNFL
ncbi:MAG: radical SAM protein [Methanophagales archaeon]|nr:radical SAM protein [Methanophagales archaeon]